MPAPKDPKKYEEWRKKIINYRLGIISPRKGKTYVELYGLEKATIIKKRISKSKQGFKHTEEAKKRIGEGHRGHPMYKSLERNRKISEANKGKKLSEETKRKISLSKLGTHHTEEAKRKISEGHTGKILSHETKIKISKANNGRIHTEEWNQKLRISNIGKHSSIRTEFKKGQLSWNEGLPKEQQPNYGKHCSAITKNKIREGNKRKDITKKKILETFEKIIEKYGTNIGKVKLKELVTQKLDCSWTPISRECKSMDSILQELNIEIPLKFRWQQKQSLIEEVVREYEGNILTQQHHNGIGIPDIETKDKVYEAKSYLYMGWQDQLDRYTQLNKEVKFVVFEDKGKTDIPRERIIVIKELVKDLPNDKRLLIQEKIERIKRDIPLEQKSLITKIESSS